MKITIKQRRLEKKLKQKELSQLAGITAAAISYYENGKRLPTVDNARKLAKALDCTIDDLYPKE